MGTQTLKAPILFDEALVAARQGLITRGIARTLIRADAGDELDSLLEAASEMRDRVKGRRITFSKKVFIPLTNLCRDYAATARFAETRASLERER